jgi:hypothetical protein
MFQTILDWSEVWALIIPLVAYSLRRNQPRFLMPVLVYLVGAFLLNLFGDIIGAFEMYLPSWLQTNILFYNIHSLFRFACFIYFFNQIGRTNFSGFKRTLLSFFLLLILTNYLFLENYFDNTHISGNLFTIEAYFLLIHCLLYYLSQLRDEIDDMSSSKTYWIVTGLSIYVVINFYIFLFYVPMIQENPMLAEKMWSVHNLAYIVLCLSITKALYVPVRLNH